MRTYENIAQLIGDTKLLQLNEIKKAYNLKANLLAKLEYSNPAGSVKDRVAWQMLQTAKEQGILKENSVVIEPTSGNTGIGLAAMCAYLKIKLILVMPETMSIERINLMKAYGATLVLTKGELGMNGAINKAKQLTEEIENSFMPLQFENEANAKAHYLTTGPEIWRDTNGQIDVFVAGVGTGGTITGTAKYLKEQKSDVHIVAVEPDASAVLSGDKAGAHKIQGIGAGFIPKILNTQAYNEIARVTNEQAYEMCKQTVREEGLLIGISSGCALYAAVQIAKRQEFKGKNIVVLLPDSGEKYLSTGVFEDKIST